MRSRLPPFTELRAFEAAARHRSFKAAAEELGVTPTAISHQIRLLEAHCGKTLFRRRPRPVSLTEAGEHLWPAVRDGIAALAQGLEAVRGVDQSGRLKVTATNACAARWLVPRLARWRALHPRLALDIVGTDAVLDLKAGDADVAIRYARKAPSDLKCVELARDRFRVVASPELAGVARSLSPSELARLPMVACEWPATDKLAPTWERFEAAARRRHRKVPRLGGLAHLTFREELHAIEAVVAGQGVGLLSDMLVGPELRDGRLVVLSPITLSGYGLHLAYPARTAKMRQIRLLEDWLLGEAHSEAGEE